jgi:transcriptional regulator with XRE-family HTH domain
VSPLGQEKDKDPGHPVDAHVGARIRLRRTLVGMSQKEFGDAIGVSFRQVQTYESGIARVSAGRLYDLARVLGVQVAFFFEEVDRMLVDESASSGATSEDRETGDGGIADVSRETINLMRAYRQIDDPKLRKLLLQLARLMRTK